MTEMTSRRNFLGGVISGLGYATASSIMNTNVLRAEDRNIRWAFGMYTWVVFHRPDPVPLEKMMEETASVGFQGIEFFQHDQMLKKNNLSIPRLKDMLKKHGLSFVSIYFAGALHDKNRHAALMEAMEAAAKDLAELGTGLMVVGPPNYKGDDEREVIRTMAGFLNEAGKITLEKYNVKICMHPHLNTLIENPRQLYYFMEKTDPRYVFFVPDTGHIWLGGGDPVKIMEDFKERIAYVHYKDAKGFVVKPDFFENVVEMGRGVIDFPAAHRILKDIGYKGWITIDLDYARESPLASAKIHSDYVRSVLDPIYK